MNGALAMLAMLVCRRLIFEFSNARINALHCFFIAKGDIFQKLRAIVLTS